MIVTRGWLAALHEFLHDATNEVARRRTAVLAQVYEAWLATRRPGPRSQSDPGGHGGHGLGTKPESGDRGAP